MDTNTDQAGVHTALRNGFGWFILLYRQDMFDKDVSIMNSIL